MSIKILTFLKDGKIYPVCEIRNGNEKFAFAFGLSRARLIIDNFDGIRQFVEDNTPDREAKP